METKECYACQAILPLSSFHRNGKRQPYRHSCKACATRKRKTPPINLEERASVYIAYLQAPQGQKRVTCELLGYDISNVRWWRRNKKIMDIVNERIPT